MNFGRIWALIERDLRKFFRSPALMMTSMVFPLLQLVVLGYAFGGKVVGVRVAVVDLDHSTESLKVREMFDGIATGPKTFKIVQYDSLSEATHALQTGEVRGLIVIPHDFSRRFYQRDRPKIAFTEDNTDQFISSAIFERVQQMVQDLNTPDVAPRLPGSIGLDTVEIYPYVPYIKYLLAGSIALSVFVVAMIGGGITFIDDKSRGLHEGYLVTPIKKSELVFGLIGAGTIKGTDGRHGADDYRRNDCRLAEFVGTGAAVLSGDGGRDGSAGDDEFHVFSDGPGGRSAGPARDLRSFEHAALFPVRRGLPDRSVSLVAEMDFGDRPVHLHRARSAQSDVEEHWH